MLREDEILRPAFVFWASLIGLGWSAVLFMVAVDIFAPSSESVLGRDFSNLWVAGHLVLEGRLDHLYEPALFRSELLQYLGIESPQNYSYPPHALFIAAPFSLMPYEVALAVWTISGAAFLYWAARPYGQPLLAILTPAAAMNIWAGHYGFWLGGLWLLFFRFLERHPSRAGAIAGVLTFKPHMGVFVAVALLAKRRALPAAILAAAGLIALSALLFGHWQDFLVETTSAQVAVLNNPHYAFYFRMMPSAYVAYGHSLWAQLAFAGAALGLLAWHRKVDPFTFAIATFIVLPYCFSYDMTVAAFGISLMIWNDWNRLSWLKRTILSVAFLSPVVSIFVPWIVPPALLAALAIAVHLDVDRPGQAANRGFQVRAEAEAL